MGAIDPRTIAASVVSLLAYFDEIIVLNPFSNPAYMKPSFSPTQSPGKFKSQTLKNVSVLLTLHPFIDSGMVHMIPDPMEFNADFRRVMMSAVEERVANWKPMKEEMRQEEALARDDFERLNLRMPENALRQHVRRSQPNITPELLDRVVEHMKDKLASDPFALLQPLPDKKAGGELQMFRGISLELALFVAHLTGSSIYTDSPAYWRQLHEHTTAAKDSESPSRWAALTQSLESLALTVELNPFINLETRSAGKLLRARRTFRNIWNALSMQTRETDFDEIAKRLAMNLERAHRDADREWKACSTSIIPSTRHWRRLELSAPATGFAMTSVHRLLITFGRPKYMRSVPMVLFLAFEKTEHDAARRD
jgi:hypothetical protein